MKFIVFSVFIWVLALFHLWDHRRFEADLAKRARGDGGDWREVGRMSDAVLLKRAFHITTRADAVRYGAPVGFFFFWLIFLHSWLPALIYIAAVAAKWLWATTAFDIADMTYRVMLGRKVIFTGVLRKN